MKFSVARNTHQELDVTNVTKDLSGCLTVALHVSVQGCLELVMLQAFIDKFVVQFIFKFTFWLFIDS